MGRKNTHVKLTARHTNSQRQADGDRDEGKREIVLERDREIQRDKSMWHEVMANHTDTDTETETDT